MIDMKDKEIEISVPASSGNIGSGFDCVGIAIDIWNKITLKQAFNSKEKLRIEYTGEKSFKNIPQEEDLIILSAKEFLKNDLSGISINCETNIPLSRGLGSSSAAIASGLLIGSNLNNEQKKPINELVELGIKSEGHPDNIAPTMLGGCVISVLNNNEWAFSKVPVPEDLNLIIFIPELEFETKKSRSMLNPQIERENAVYNIGRAALLINCLNNKDFSQLKYATQDMIHQDIRFENFKEMRYLLESGLEAGALSGFLAGSGPSIIFFSHGREMTIKYELLECARKHNIKGKVIITKPTNKGAHLKLIK